MAEIKYFNGFNLLDWRTLIPTFGNWGGPGWSGGESGDTILIFN